MNDPKKLIAIAAVVMLALFGGGTLLYQSYEKKQAKESAQKNRELLATPHSPVYGPTDAKVEIVEFLDPECETCRQFYPLVKQIVNAHPGKVKLIVRYAPFHQNAGFVATVLEATRKHGKYWEAMSLFFERLPQWGSHHHPNPELLWTYLPELGLSAGLIREEIKDPEIQKRINKDIEDVKRFGVRKTPTFYVNGMPLPTFGFQQLNDAVLQAIKENY